MTVIMFQFFMPTTVMMTAN